MLPSQPFHVVRSILLHIGSSVHAILFIVWLAGHYMIYQTSGLVFNCIAALGFASGDYATRKILKEL